MKKEQTWIAVDGHGDERIFHEKPFRSFPNMSLEVLWGRRWEIPCIDSDLKHGIMLPKGTIKMLIGKDLTYNDEPIRLKIKC